MTEKRAGDMRRWSTALILAAALALPRGRAAAQVIEGSVVDAGTKTPIPGATVTFIGKDSSVVTVQTSEHGQFSASLKRAGQYSLQVRRVGYSELQTTGSDVAKNGDTITLAIELSHLMVALDTVVTMDKSSVFPTTPGHEFVRRHYALNEGVQVSGWLIEKSGMSLSEYLGKYVPGLHTTDVIQAYNPAAPTRLTPPALPALHGRFLMADSGSQCLYGRVDRYSMVFLLQNKDVETIDELVSVKNIMGVEVFRSPRDVPPEWKSIAQVPTIFMRRNNGEYYLLGDTGFPSVNVAGLQDQNMLAIEQFKGDSTQAALTSVCAMPPWRRTPEDAVPGVTPQTDAGHDAARTVGSSTPWILMDYSR